MSVKGFNINGLIEKYDYNALENKPSILDSPVQSVNGKTGDVVLNATDVGAGTYSKPSGGIPKTDLASAVQTSLDKADTAYQKPSGGIPASDLAPGVIQTIPTKTSDLNNDSGFVNAAGAAAAAPVQSVNGQTGAVTVQAATDAQVSTAVNTWCGNNVAQETGYVLDSTLTMSNAAAPADKVGELKSAITKKMVLVYSENKWNENNTVSGYMLAKGTEGANASYEHLIDPIPVSPGDVVRSYEINARGNFATSGMRWFCAMNSSKQAVEASGSNSNITSYTVPSGIAYVNPTLNISGQKRMITINLEAREFIDYADPWYVATGDFIGTLDIDENSDFDTKYLDFSMVNRLDPSTCQPNKFINGTSGAISDNSGYYVTNYMKVRPGETIQIWEKDLSGTIPMRTVAVYDKDKTLIGSLGTNTQVNSYTQSGNAAYIRASVGYNASYFVNTPYGQIAVTDIDPLYIPGYGNKPIANSEYFRKQIFVKASDTESEVIAKLVQAYNLANCDVHFERATYQFGDGLASVQTDYHLNSNEIPVGNNCRYYFNGATLTATIDLTQHPGSGGEEFYVNLLGTQRMPTSFEMYDGVLEATDTRYVMHDESSALKGSYRHLYQNMEMHYHTNTRAEVIRKALGGGTGESGVVEIIGCKFSTDATDACLSFHGNGSDVVGAKFDLNIRNCWFSNGFRAGELSANQTARLFYTGSSSGTAPNTSYARWTVTSFLNEVRT